MKIYAFAAFAGVLLCAASANALILVDQSPDAVGVAPFGVFTNRAIAQNFMFRFTVGATTLTGIDIYSGFNAFYGSRIANVGSTVVVKLAPDLAGTPDVGNLVSWSTKISAMDSFLSTADPTLERIHADFSQAVPAGDYWIGLSGDADEIGQSMSFVGTGQGVWQLLGNSPRYDNGGFMTGYFNVYGGSVPEPASWALMIAGFGIVGAALRGRRSAALA